ncbi:aldehyde dehydrogenase family protein [Rhodococcus sp. 077-4]|uniref:aldehyde dehydrogenase family protein n=1 Tax=Rhodococcus sp. 077-4 TaxID=2789271 RepID=UPI0039F498F0
MSIATNESPTAPSSNVVDYLQLIGGEFRAASNGGWIDSVNPTTGQVWARVPAGNTDDIDLAVAAASAAYEDWRSTPAAQRASILRAWARSVREHADELWRLDSTDNGRARVETSPAILGGAGQIEFHAGLAETITGETVDISPTASTYSVREPFGVVGLIIPWNAPLAMFLAKVSAAVAAGNTIVVKPPERASVSVLAAARYLADAGLPPGVVNVVTGEGSAAGEALVIHPEVRKISFTGSTATGRRITEKSTSNLKVLGLELGGKSPHIVFADADLDAAAISVSAGIFTGSAGQACIAGSRILIERSIFEDFVDRLRIIASRMTLGDPLAESTDMGPIAFDTQFEKVREYVKVGSAEGATLAFGGRSGAELFDEASPLSGGYFIEPTLFVTDDNTSRICQEEIFGPVAVALAFDTEEEAVALANDSLYGLAAGVWSSDLGRVHRLIRRIRSGTVWVNTYRRLHWALPFSGQKESGNRPSNGPHALDEWLEHKSVWIEHGA